MSRHALQPQARQVPHPVPRGLRGELRCRYVTTASIPKERSGRPVRFPVTRVATCLSLASVSTVKRGLRLPCVHCLHVSFADSDSRFLSKPVVKPLPLPLPLPLYMIGQWNTQLSALLVLVLA